MPLDRSENTVRAAPKRASSQTALDLPKLRSRDPQIRDQDVPAKLLLVDDDELELSLMADRLGAAGFQVTVASNGEEALKILEHEWFPLILTDWQMPVMDGIQLVEQLREHGGDSYFIMLSVRATSEDFDRGYCAGVDDYLSKKSPDTEIMARIEAGLSTVALRRSLRQSRAALAISQSQNATTYVNAKHQLVTRLQSEMGRARRYQRACSVLILGVHPSMTTVKAEHAMSMPAPIDDSVRLEFMQALQGVIRVDIDSVVLYESGERHVQLAIVLPEAGPAEVAVIRGRVRAAVLQTVRNHVAMVDAFDVSVGAASVDPSIDRAGLTAEVLLTAAENCRRCMASCGARRLAAVQTSVVSKVSIPCRHGYAVADHCLELDHRYAAENQNVPVPSTYASATPPAA